MEPLDNHSPEDSAPRASLSRMVQRLFHMRRFPGTITLETLLTRMGPGERLILAIAGIALTIATLGLLYTLSSENMTLQAAQGGSLTEGIVGTPRFINPLLASSDADRDLTMLVYSGLVRAMPDGSLVNDLAESYSISEDGTIYTFVLRQDAVFHDGTPVTASDVLFTIETAKNPDIKSPKRANWEGVSVEVLDEKTVQFTIAQSYAPFLENLTLGILPQHLWKGVTADDFPFHQLNTNPVGSGPYRIGVIRTDATQTPTSYMLRAFDRFTLGTPYIPTLTIRLYPSEDELIAAFNIGDIDAIAGVTASRISDLAVNNAEVITSTLPRVFAVFLNQNHAPIFLDADVREALDIALDRNALIDAALSGYGTALSGPIPPGILEHDIAEAADTLTSEERIATAQSILEDGGWTLNEETGFYEDSDGQELAFAISTADTPELAASAETVAAVWRLVGANVSVKLFSASAINVQVIRPREYEALLFGIVVGRSLDLYAFWHSSQRTDPGLNLGLYTNAKADTLLRDARAETDRRTRESSLAAFSEEVQNDRPAVFLYAPKFVYVVPKKLHGVALASLTSTSERFLNVHEWHVERKSVWHIFSN